MRRLAPREQQVIDLISRGKTDKEIAVELGIGVRTVRTHLERLYRKSDVHSRAEAVAFYAATPPNPVAVGDFNGDGKPDLAVANRNAMEISILLGNGDGTFQAAVSYPTSGAPNSIAVGDFDGDGHLDLAVVHANVTEISIMLGNGDGTFQDPTYHATGSSLLAVAVGDFNGDGKPDLAVVDTITSQVYVWLGHGNGTFQAVPAATTGTPQQWEISTALGDTTVADGGGGLL